MPNIEYIDSYFKGELGQEEKRQFEQRIEEDPLFAEEVAFYCSAMHVIKDDLANEKKDRFRKLYQEVGSTVNKTRPLLVKKLWPYIAAAAIVTGLIIGWLMYATPTSVQRLADRYIQEHFEQPEGVKMAGKQDSLDAAVQLYNDGKLSEALNQFQVILKSDSSNDKTIKMAGIVSLRTGDYDKAVYYFTRLENLKLQSNPGKFYHALALIKRNQNGDKEMAKQLLTQVMSDQELDEHETAKKWMKSF